MSYLTTSRRVFGCAVARPVLRLASLIFLVGVYAAVPVKADAPGLQLAYQATFPNGLLRASVDHLGIGPMLTGDSQIANSDPTYTQLPGELLIAITHPAGVPTNVVASAGVFATPVNFGPGTVSHLSATFRAPKGPADGGWAVAINARTGGRNDLSSETRLNVTLRMAPGGVLKLNVPFGATVPTATVVPTVMRDLIFSAVSPKPFTLELSIDRITGTGKALLTVDNYQVPLTFMLSTFPAIGGPTISAMGAGVAANSTPPGQIVSVHLREFRIYARM